MNTKEEWKPIPGYEGRYEASTWGRIRGLKRLDTRGRRINPKILKPGTNATGHQFVYLHSKSGGITKLYVHRLVLTTFVGSCPPRHECLHADDNPSNNSLPNLRWGTRSENMLDAIANGKRTYPRAKPR